MWIFEGVGRICKLCSHNIYNIRNTFTTIVVFTLNALQINYYENTQQFPITMKIIFLRGFSSSKKKNYITIKFYSYLLSVFEYIYFIDAIFDWVCSKKSSKIWYFAQISLKTSSNIINNHVFSLDFWCLLNCIAVSTCYII